MEFGTRLKIMRVARGLTQVDLAERTGISNVHLSLVETGRMLPTPAQVAQIKEALTWNEGEETALAVLGQPA